MNLPKSENTGYFLSISAAAALFASLCAQAFGQQPAKDQVHPLLREAWLQYQDYENRDREQVVSLFEKYIEEDPCSVFLAEIYYRLGSLYSNNANHKRGETLDREKANVHFKKAHELYGKKYSVEADAAWSFLAFAPGEPTSSRKAYYEWHRNLFDKGTSEDIYPIRGIALYVLYNCTPELDPNEKKGQYRSYKKNFPIQNISIERALFQYASYIDLLDFVRSYPGTELAKHCREQLNEIDDRLELFDISKLDSEPRATLASEDKATQVTVESQANEIRQETEMPEQDSSAEQTGDTSQIDDAKRTAWVVYLLIVCATLSGGFLYYVGMRRKKAKGNEQS